MSLIFYRFYLGFLAFCILFIVNTSFGSLQRQSMQDLGDHGNTICRSSCHGRNTTTSCRNETTDGRCCVSNSIVVGLDLSNCSLKVMPSLKSVERLRWLYLQGNPGLNCDDKTFLNSFKGLKNLSEIVLPEKCNCTGGNDLWKNSSVHDGERSCSQQRTDSCKILNVTCPDNAECFPNGPGFSECLCRPGWFGYKCLVKHGFPWTVVFASIGGSTLFLIVVLLLHQRKRRKENAVPYTQWQ